MTTRRHEDISLLARLRATIRETIGRYLPSGSRVAFINYPNISNVGDPALWLGSWKLIRDLDVHVMYACDARTYDPNAIAGIRGLDRIVINGGGNFGDLWKGQQQTRERVLRDFPGIPTLQLPQSVWFEDDTNLDRMRRLMERHDDLQLLWREERSLTFAEENLPGRHAACPDTALALEPLERSQAPSVDVLWLARTDKERRHGTVPDLGRGVSVEVTDWVDPSTGRSPNVKERLASLVHDRLRPRLRTGVDNRMITGLYRATLVPLAAHHVRRGVSILSRGRVVVTDRLHAHILCLVAGIPHIVLDNSYGKVRAVYDTWTFDGASTAFVESAEDIPREVQRLLSGL